MHSYPDGNGITHEEYHDTTRAKVGFSLKERNLEEQISIKGIFGMQNKVSVEYWDDYDCVYRTGTFRMEAPTITHRNSVGNDISYNATPIVLEEL